MSASIKWQDVFRTLGYDVEVATDGDFSFADNGVPFRCMVEADDPTYLHLILPGVWVDVNHSPEARARASAIVHDINGTVKVAKLILQVHGVHVSVEAHYFTLRGAARQIPKLLENAKVAGHLFDKAFHQDETERKLTLLS